MLQLHGNMVTKVARVQYCRVPIREGRRVRLRSLWFAAVGAIRGIVTCMRGCDDSHAVEGFTCGRVPTLHDKLVGILQRGEAYKNVDIRKVFAGGSLDDEGGPTTSILVNELKQSFDIMSLLGEALVSSASERHRSPHSVILNGSFL